MLKLNHLSDFIISEYKSGKTIVAIASELNEYPQAVSNLLKNKLNIKSFLPNQGNIRYFENINTNTKAYLLGFIIADGCVQHFTKTSKGLSVTIHKKDIKVLELLKSEIGNEHPIRFLKNNLVRFQLANKDLYQDLINLGISERKSLSMENIITNVPYQFRNSLILGYFDGDGTVSKPAPNNSNRKNLIVSFRGTKEFLQGIADHLQLNRYNIKQYDAIPTLYFSEKNNILKFFNIYKENDFYLKRKYEIFASRINQVQTISST